MIKLTPAQATVFASDACAAIDQSHDNAWNLITQRNVTRSQWEAWFVAHVCAAMCDVAKAWRPRIAGINPKLMLSVSSVFTHQSPYVKWSSGRCELADLLIAFIDRTSSPGLGFAVLVQAKQADSNPAKLSTKSEKLQFHLLNVRPTFDVDAKAAPARVILPMSRLGHDEAILYGVNPPKKLASNPPPWGSHRWQTGGGLATTPVANQVTLARSLATTLVEQFQGNEGWDFTLPPAGKDWQHFASSPRDDWAMMINYLLEATFRKPLKSFHKIIKQPNRGRNIPMFMQCHPAHGLTMSFYHYAPGDFEDGAPLDWIAPASEEGPEWYAVSNSPLYEIGGGSGGRGPGGEGEDEYEPDNGPISAIVFELGRRAD